MTRVYTPAKGLTLVEVLVVIVIIGLLVALLLPAIQAARESTRTSACANKVRQIATAMQTHHDALRKFPAGQNILFGTWEYTDGNWSVALDNTKTQSNNRSCWMHFVSAYMEMTDVYTAVTTALKKNSPAGLYSLSVALLKHDSFMCPADPNAGKISYAGSSARGFCGNYLACSGSATWGGYGTGNTLDGIFFCKSAVKISDITDGLSKTVMLGEAVVVPETPTQDQRGDYFNAYAGEVLFSTRYQPNTTVKDQTTYVTNWSPWAPAQAGNPLVQSTRSRHLGGVNVAMADGSVRFVGNTVHAAAWTAMGSRAGQESSGIPE